MTTMSETELLGLSPAAEEKMDTETTTPSPQSIQKAKGPAAELEPTGKRPEMDALGIVFAVKKNYGRDRSCTPEGLTLSKRPRRTASEIPTGTSGVRPEHRLQTREKEPRVLVQHRNMLPGKVEAKPFFHVTIDDSGWIHFS
ncbi:unnamed protein product [Caenorhabditis auriculariae]|uniref:Uncharacterized protein n=1 Tax=Caenorhabditis auriculariae TaxID=2777116 RepID=A0A8S1HJP2_9PELO|nr:unnamed protein product [Caenorhabditis auriculariae]